MASLFRHIQSCGVAGQAKILFLISGSRLHQLKLVVGRMWVVALQTIAHRRLVHCALDVGGVLVGVTGQTQAVRRGRYQLHARYILVSAHFMAAGASGRNCRVNEFAFRFFRMAFQALRRRGILFQRHGMDIRTQCQHRNEENREARLSGIILENRPEVARCIPIPLAPVAASDSPSEWSAGALAYRSASLALPPEPARL